MKKIITLITLITVLFITTPSLAIDPGIYIGVGGSFASEDFDINDTGLEEFGLSVDVEDTYGINLKVGYRVNDISSWEVRVDYLPGFEWEDEGEYRGTTFTAKVKGDILTCMLATKLSPNLGSDYIRPFVIAGFGFMHGKIDVDVSANGHSASASATETDLCVKAGLGIDLFMSKSFSLTGEGSYVVGLGDMDEFRYINYTVGINYYF